MGKKGNIFLGVFSIFLFCLLLSTTTTIAVGDWGQLKPGDEMRWKFDTDAYDMTQIVTIEIIDISGADITVSYDSTVIYNGYTYDYSGTDTVEDDVGMMILSQSYMTKLEADADEEDDLSWTQTTYDFQGTNCKVHYLKGVSYYGDLAEYWWDQGTGILLEAKNQYNGYTDTVELQSTTASLTRAGICMGTIFIALVSVVTLVSLNMVRYWKKKKL